MNKKLEIYLQPTYYLDSDSPEIIEFARDAVASASTDLEKAIKVYYAVRDQVRYNPYLFTLNKEDYRASQILSKGEGFCVHKALLLAAVARAVQLPCRVGFANVRNHLTTEKLKKLMQNDLFVFHGYDEFFLEGKWVKATPAFDINLCERFAIFPLEFDGKNDSIFHPLDKEGRKHMEYVHDYGPFDDFPFEKMKEETFKYYPHLIEMAKNAGSIPKNDFHKEADEENRL
ncbi:MAG: transglutaminase family protein [bacterium]|nr:transglutaminase family protein [bacterium]